MRLLRLSSTVLLSTLTCAGSYGITLEETIQQSVLSSPRVLQTVKVCLANEQAFKGAKGGYLPSLDARGAIGYEHSHNNSTRAQQGGHRTLLRREVSLEARQMLFDGFSTMQNVARNKFKHNASAWAVSAAANQAALRVAEAYVNVLRNRELVKSSQENLRIHKRTSDMIQKRSISGVSRNTDAVQASGRLAQASSNLESAKGNQKDSETYFFRETGMNPGRLSTPKINSIWMPKSESEAIDAAIEHHPTLLAANSDILEALAQHKESYSPIMPHIDLVGTIGYARDLDGVPGQNNERKIMLEGRWNLLKGGSDFRRRRETAYLTQEAAEIRNNTYREVIENTRLAWVSHKTNIKLLVQHKKHMDASRNTIDAYAKQFQLGQRTLLDLLNSENEYFTAKGVYINSKYDLLISKLRLVAATGLLNEELGIDLSSLGLDSHHLHNIMDYPDILERADKYRHNSNNRSYSHGHDHGRYAHHHHGKGHHHHSGDHHPKGCKCDSCTKEVVHKNECGCPRCSSAHNHGYKKCTTGRCSRRDRVADRSDNSTQHRRRRYSHQNNPVEYEPTRYSDSSSKSQGNYTLQLLASSDEGAVRRFIQRSGLSGDASYYRTQKSNGDDWYVVTYGNFGTKRAAINAVNDLPSSAQAFKPWPRTVTGMQYAERIDGPAYDSSFV